jgi:hypothetical protein
MILEVDLHGSEQPSLPRQLYDTAISYVQRMHDTVIVCGHWIICPYCLMDPERQTVKFYNAILKNDPEAIQHIIRRRAMSPNHLLLDDSKPVLPLILAAQKAHLESIKALLSLGADVNSQIQAPGLGSYPSSLIAICATEGVDPERVRKIVKLLLEQGADPSRHCVMLTKTERKEFERIQDELKKQRRNEPNMVQIPQAQDWLRQRNALEFAKKHKYTDAAELLSKALIEYRKKGLKTDERYSQQSDLF